MNEAAAGLRIGDAEREAAVHALGDHFAAGRLTKEEYDERADRAWSARTASALAPLFADLPRAEQAASDPARGLPPRRPTRPRWWAPVLVVLATLVVLTHLPLFALAAVVWLLWARHTRRWRADRWRAERWGTDRWDQQLR